MWTDYCCDKRIIDIILQIKFIFYIKSGVEMCKIKTIRI